MTRSRLLLALGAVLTLLLALIVAAPNASAEPPIVWYVHFGSYATGSSPNVWSNRNPTWLVGSDPYLTFGVNGNMVDAGANTCAPSGICWQSNTGNVGPGPWQAYWDSRPGANSGHFRIYSHDGVIRFDTNTGSLDDVLMIEYNNGCLDMFASANHVNWGLPIWQNSYASACSIYH